LICAAFFLPCTKCGEGPTDPRDARRWRGQPPASNATASGASDRPVAEAVRAAATAQHDAGAASPQAKHVEIERENFWQTLGTRLPHELKSALSQIGSAEVTEGNANLAMSAAEANTVTHALKTLVEYRIQVVRC